MTNTRRSTLLGWLQKVFITLLKKHRPFAVRLFFVHDPFWISASGEKSKGTAGASSYLVLSDRVTGEYAVNNTMQTLNFSIFTVPLAIFVALINFVNLSVARSVGSVGVAGLAKVARAIEGGVIKQYFTKSLIKNLIDILLSVLLVISSMNFTNQLVGISVSSFDMWIGPKVWFTMLFILLIGSILTGTYPSNTIPDFKRSNC
ncbi:hypothetical protein QQ020_03025 [Fulvivirgaceae bacterium BMA12]|uniref:Uncharacterized protein n=1 Tax=Agaribacillus aureus TaxID=3051825 RepID=A0ABT8KZW8_9BACT|nr:hypothetical protein [Fulvivirgaceae bacterium BMA12]